MTDQQSTPYVNTPEILYRLRAANGDLLYVGITRDWPTRMKQHAADKLWWDEVRFTEMVYIDGTRAQIEALEKAVIKTELPRFNKQHAVTRTMAAPNPAYQTDDWKTFKLGEDVEHQTFGKGIILEIRGAGTDRAEATIRFPDTVGTKHLALAWAPLRRWNIF